MSSPTPRSAVWYFVGSGRSGSTLIAQVLASAPGVVNVGEAVWIGRNLERDDVGCGCGTALRECAWWHELRLRDAVPSASTSSALTSVRQRSLLRPTWWRRGQRARRFGSELATMYEAALASTDAHVVVDASKQLAPALALRAQRRLAVHYIHVIRNPATVASKWATGKADARFPGDSLAAWEPARALHSWVTREVLCTVLVRWRVPRRHWHSVRYEDFASEPERVLRELFERLHAPEGADVVIANRTVRLRGPQHSVAGNPSRHAGESIEIVPDAKPGTLPPTPRWVRGLARCWQLAYRYPLRPSPDSRR